MKKAMEMKLVVRPVIGCLMHTHFWEGPCRAGYREDMTPEAETASADKLFAAAKATLAGVQAQVELLPAIDVTGGQAVRWPGRAGNGSVRRGSRSASF